MVKRRTGGPPDHAALNRRRLLSGAIGMGIGLRLSPALAKADDPRKLPPQADDDIVFPSWEHADRLVTPDDVPLDGPPLLAYPRDPATGTPREKSRLNQILLVRFDEAQLSDETRVLGVAGIVAYSGVCTHTGCSVTEWSVEARNFLCPCHASQFDPRAQAAVIGGPAPRPLPMLPLQLAGNTLKVAGPFSARVGAKKN
jgi:Rieske Fe-S protein